MFLDSTLKCPDEATSPEAFWMWHQNDIALQGFLQHALSPTDFTLTADRPTGHAMYAALRNRHEKCRPFAQLLLLKEYLDIFFDDETPFDHTCAQIEELHERICNMGPIDDDKLLTFGYLHALGDRYMHLQSTIQIQSTHPNFDTKSVQLLFDRESCLKRNQKKAATAIPSNPIALAASTNTTRPPRAPCGNCKRTNHATDYCIHPGGKLAGKTIEEARAIQASHRLANMSAPQPTARQSRAPATSGPQRAFISSQITQHAPVLSYRGAQYGLLPPPPAPSPSPSPSLPVADPSWQPHASAHISVAPDNDPLWQPTETYPHPVPIYTQPDTTYTQPGTAYTQQDTAYISPVPHFPPHPSAPYHYRSYLAHIVDPPRFASLADDLGDLGTVSVLPDDRSSLPLFSVSRSCSLSSDSSPHCSLDWDEHWPAAYTASFSSGSSECVPFIFDSGASCHITPVRSDFKTFRPIISWPVTGLGSNMGLGDGLGRGCGKRFGTLAHRLVFVPVADLLLGFGRRSWVVGGVGGGVW